MPLLLLTGLPAQAHAQEAAVHTVRPGDTLTRISAARGVSVADLLRFNGLGLETVLYPGDELRLTGAAAPAPAAGTYTVQPNDGWWVIARRTGVSAAQLQRLNGMSASSMLHPGMVLTTQRTAAAPKAPASPADASSDSGDTGSDAPDNAGLERPSSQTSDATTRSADETAISETDLKHIGDVFDSPPADFTIHPKLQQAMQKRAASVHEGGIDWGTGEMLAVGSLLMDGTPVRLAGQDSRRGTFVQRHAVLIDKNTGEEWTPLNYLGGGQARFWVYDSLLSEFAALGFEYGYSVERPDALVMWEAQFGDFVNGAASIIDEFISSSEQKWGQNSSVVLLLPHGYEGQGPDHSSARIERFLALCAQNNMTVAFPSTPASYFHLLRRQAYHRPRRPLIVFTPKSMLRLKAASSQPEDFTEGTFRAVLPDMVGPKGEDVTRVIVAAGKVTWDLEAERKKRGDEQTAILHLERYYPLPGEELAAELAKYPNAEIVLVQEEPENQGAWPFLAMNLPADLAQHGETRALRAVTRPASASPAAGTAKKHAQEQADLISRAFDR